MSSSLSIYKIYCITENRWKTILVEDEVVPTKCPDNDTHVIDQAKTYEHANLYSGMRLDQYGRIMVVATSKRDPYTWTSFTSCGDTATTYGEGNILELEVTNDQLTNSVTTDLLLEGFDLHYGILEKMALFGDRASLSIGAAATNMVPGTGFKIDELTYRIKKDAAGTLQPSGDVVPIYAYDATTWKPNGYWTKVGPGYSINDFVYVANGTGVYNFYPVEVPCGYIAKNISLLGNNDIVFTNEDACYIHKGYKFKLEGKITKPQAGRAPLQLALTLKLNRKTIA